jgi:hypothetical protein
LCIAKYLFYSHIVQLQWIRKRPLGFEWDRATVTLLGPQDVCRMSPQIPKRPWRMQVVEEDTETTTALMQSIDG